MRLRFEDRLKHAAKEIGIDAIGITTAEPFYEAGSRLRQMEERGFLSPWAEPDLARRIHPRELMEDAASLIAVAVSYRGTAGAGEDAQSDGVRRGRLARFAQYQDYHRVLENCMGRLAEYMRQEYPELKAQLFVDTGPLIDREVARRAGLGFYGKNAALIHPELGSFLALGEIVVNIPLQPDQPLESQCGDCTLCLKACPQQAIAAPGEINSRECLAHYTQEKGFLQPGIRRKLGTRLWGCDTCQDICPYNRRAVRGRELLLQPHEFGAGPDLTQIVRLSNREYAERLGDTAMAWRGRTTLQRNALINLGNLRNPDAVPILAEALADRRPLIRGTAAWALGEIGGEEAQRLLAKALEQETEAGVRAELESALAGRR